MSHRVTTCWKRCNPCGR